MVLSQFPYPMTVTMVHLASIAIFSTPMLKVIMRNNIYLSIYIVIPFIYIKPVKINRFCTANQLKIYLKAKNSLSTKLISDPWIWIKWINSWHQIWFHDILLDVTNSWIWICLVTSQEYSITSRHNLSFKTIRTSLIMIRCIAGCTIEKLSI